MSFAGFRLTRIRGQSMGQTIPDGSFVLTRVRNQYKVGDVVLVDHCGLGRIIKRIAEASPPAYTLSGDDPRSISSDAMGQINESDILGAMIWTLRPPRP